MKSLLSLFVFFLLAATLLSGCYWNETVGTSFIAVETDSAKPTQCKGPGLHSGDSFFDDLVPIGMGTLTFDVEDPEVATKDNQLVGVRITVQARRSSECPELMDMLTRWPSLLNDDSLKTTISSTALEGIKNGVRLYTLDGLLTDRNGMADTILEQLQLDAAEYNTEIINVTVSNIALNAAYVEQLNLNAQYTAQIEGLRKQQEQIAIQGETDRIQQEQTALVYEAQLAAEEAKTAVEVEIAEREGKKTAAAQQVYADNPQAFHLKELELLQDVVGEGTVYFVPDLNTLTLLLTQPGAPPVVPVPAEPQ